MNSFSEVLAVLIKKDFIQARNKKLSFPDLPDYVANVDIKKLNFDDNLKIIIKVICQKNHLNCSLINIINLDKAIVQNMVECSDNDFKKIKTECLEYAYKNLSDEDRKLWICDFISLNNKNCWEELKQEKKGQLMYGRY